MRRLVIFGLVVIMTICNGCFGVKQASQNSTNASYSVKDDLDRELNFAAKPKRIVSLTYGTDEILTALVDVERIVAYSRWAGDSGISFITEKQAQVVGCKIYDNSEAILALKPDLVVASVATDRSLVDLLANMGINVYVARSPHNYQDMCAKICGIAIAVGETEQAEKIIKDMDLRLQKLEERLSKIPPNKMKTAIAFNFTSAMGRPGDLLDSMLKMAHVINGAAIGIETSKIRHTSTPVISKEQVVSIDPDIFMLPTWNYNNKHDAKEYARTIENDPAFKQLKAIKNKQIKFIEDRYRYVASQHIVEAVENIAMAIYPEYF